MKDILVTLTSVLFYNIVIFIPSLDNAKKEDTHDISHVYINGYIDIYIYIDTRI